HLLLGLLDIPEPMDTLRDAKLLRQKFQTGLHLAATDDEQTERHAAFGERGAGLHNHFRMLEWPQDRNRAEHDFIRCNSILRIEFGAELRIGQVAIEIDALVDNEHAPRVDAEVDDLIAYESRDCHEALDGRGEEERTNSQQGSLPRPRFDQSGVGLREDDLSNAAETRHPRNGIEVSEELDIDGIDVVPPDDRTQAAEVLQRAVLVVGFFHDHAGFLVSAAELRRNLVEYDYGSSAARLGSAAYGKMLVVPARS